MSTVIGWIMSYPGETAAGVLLVVATLGVGRCVQERDTRIQAEAVAEERIADFRAADSALKVITTELQAKAEEWRQDSLRHVARIDSLNTALEATQQDISEASARAVAAGDSLEATLDSVAVVLPGVGATARAQWREHRRADREKDRAEEREDEQQEQKLRERTAERDQAREQRDRERAAKEAALRVANEAREALEARTQIESGPSWGERLIWTGVGAGIGALGVTLSQ